MPKNASRVDAVAPLNKLVAAEIVRPVPKNHMRVCFGVSSHEIPDIVSRNQDQLIYSIYATVVMKSSSCSSLDDIEDMENYLPVGVRVVGFISTVDEDLANVKGEVHVVPRFFLTPGLTNQLQGAEIIPVFEEGVEALSVVEVTFDARRSSGKTDPVHWTKFFTLLVGEDVYSMERTPTDSSGEVVEQAHILSPVDSNVNTTVQLRVVVVLPPRTTCCGRTLTQLLSGGQELGIPFWCEKDAITINDTTGKDGGRFPFPFVLYVQEKQKQTDELPLSWKDLKGDFKDIFGISIQREQVKDRRFQKQPASKTQASTGSGVNKALVVTMALSLLVLVLGVLLA